MTEAEARALFTRFAAPLVSQANSAARRESATDLARALWLAMACGPEMEEATWKALVETGGLEPDLLEAVRIVEDLETVARDCGGDGLRG